MKIIAVETKDASGETIVFGKYTYEPIDFAAVPRGVRFDAQRGRAGQVVEYAFGGFMRAEHGEGDVYARRTDRSDGVVTYYRRVGGQ